MGWMKHIHLACEEAREASADSRSTRFVYFVRPVGRDGEIVTLAKPMAGRLADRVTKRGGVVQLHGVYRNGVEIDPQTHAERLSHTDAVALARKQAQHLSTLATHRPTILYLATYPSGSRGPVIRFDPLPRQTVDGLTLETVAVFRGGEELTLASIEAYCPMGMFWHAKLLRMDGSEIDDDESRPGWTDARCAAMCLHDWAEDNGYLVTGLTIEGTAVDLSAITARKRS